jgi:hypothetical protein
VHEPVRRSIPVVARFDHSSSRICDRRSGFTPENRSIGLSRWNDSQEETERELGLPVD